MNPLFANAWILYFLWIIPLMAFWWYSSFSKREKKLSTFISQDMQAKLRPSSSKQRFIWQITLLISGLLLMLLALARPQWGTSEVKVFQRGRDLIIALDVSRSMLASDVHPNRLLRAKADIMDLIRELRGDRAGLITFRYKAIQRCPLTTDYAYLQQSLDGVTIDSAPAGETDIGNTITKALEAFDNESGSHKAIILISDGEDLSGKAMAAAEEAGKRKIPIFTVGLGSRNGSKIKDRDNKSVYQKHNGEDVVTKLDHETLYAIAQKSGGAYIPVETTSMNLGTLYQNHLKLISAQDIEETLQRRHIERYQIFLLPAFVLILAACFFSRGRLAANAKPTSSVAGALQNNGIVNNTTMKSPPPVSTVGATSALLTLLCIAAHISSAQTNSRPVGVNPQTNVTATATTVSQTIPPGREGARMAQTLFRLGQYEKAAHVYLEALTSSSAASQHDFKYNAAVSLFKARKFEEAARLLQELMQTESKWTPATAMALGSTLYHSAETKDTQNPTNIIMRAQLLKEAGEAFKDASRMQPDDVNPKHNLAVILDQLPKAEKEAEIAQLMQKYQNSQAGDVAHELLLNQRNIADSLPEIFTNNSPSQIQQFENIARQQKENSNLWIPLKEKMLNAMAAQAQQNPGTTNLQQQIAELNQHIDAIHENMNKTAGQLRNLDQSGYNSALASQAGVYMLWKAIAPYAQLLQEDILAQSNLLSNTTQEMDFASATATQDEALNLTQLFLERFQQSVPEQTGQPESPAPAPDAASTDNPQQPPEQDKGLSAEDREKIIGHAGMAITAQQNASKLLNEKQSADSLVEQQRAYDILKEIEKLLPKDKQQNQDQQQNQDNKDQQDQQNKDQQQNDQNQNQNNDQQQNKPEENKQGQPPKDDKDENPEEIKKLLEKALEREKEHETEKQKQNRDIPMSIRERDW